MPCTRPRPAFEKARPAMYSAQHIFVRASMFEPSQDCVAQRAGDQADRLKGQGVGVGRVRIADVGLNGVRQGVNTGGSRQRRRHADHEHRVVQSQMRKAVRVHHEHLCLRLFVRDDVGTRALGAGCRPSC